MSKNNGLMFPKKAWKNKKRTQKKKRILPTTKGVCYICAHRYNDWSCKPTQEHHIIYGGGQRKDSEREGIKVYLCLKHHGTGEEGVHGSREMREWLCREAQREYEKTHTREEWMQEFKKNYLEEENE